MLGRYLGPAIDVGPAMKTNITKANGEVLHRLTYHGLKEDKKSNQAHVSSRKEFDNSTREKLGTKISPDNFLDVNLEDTRLYEMYEDNTTDEEGVFTGKAEDDEDPVMATGLDHEVPAPEVNDNYVNASVMLKIWNIYDRGKVIGRKRYAYGNAVVSTNDNPIIDKREYRAEFDYEEVIELTSNVIAESVYTSCDDSGNEYIIMG